MTHITTLLQQFVNNLRRASYAAPLSITLPNRTFDQLWGEGPGAAKAVEERERFIVDTLYLQHFGDKIEIKRETPMVVSKVEGGT